MQTLATKAEVTDAITHVAREIIRDFTGQTPLFVCLLRGAAPFSAQLMSTITRLAPDFHPELDYMMVSTYGTGRQAGSPHIVTDIAPTTSTVNRTVIILDDVLDKGVTAHFVTQHLLAKGTQQVKLAVLVDKNTSRIQPMMADYACLQADDVWLAGMGMDDSATAPEAYRWSDRIIRLD